MWIRGALHLDGLVCSVLALLAVVSVVAQHGARRERRPPVHRDQQPWAQLLEALRRLKVLLGQGEDWGE